MREHVAAFQLAAAHLARPRCYLPPAACLWPFIRDLLSVAEIDLVEPEGGARLAGGTPATLWQVRGLVLARSRPRFHSPTRRLSSPVCRTRVIAPAVVELRVAQTDALANRRGKCALSRRSHSGPLALPRAGARYRWLSSPGVRRRNACLPHPSRHAPVLSALLAARLFSRRPFRLVRSGAFPSARLMGRRLFTTGSGFRRRAPLGAAAGKPSSSPLPIALVR